jgi:hypothetical protein
VTIGRKEGRNEGRQRKEGRDKGENEDRKNNELKAALRGPQHTTVVRVHVHDGWRQLRGGGGGGGGW